MMLPHAGSSLSITTAKPTSPSRNGRASEITMLMTTDTLLTGRELLRPGWIEVSDGTVRAIGAGTPPRPADRHLGAVTVVPGFVDTHVHGGAARTFPASRPKRPPRWDCTFGTAPPRSLLRWSPPARPVVRQVGELADEVRAGVIAGIHLEGPGCPPSDVAPTSRP